MRQIEAFVNAFFDEHLRTPTMREIEHGTGLSRQTASSYLRTMAEQGMLEYDGRGGIVTEHIRTCAASQVVSLPIIGHVAAGVLTAAEEVREGFVEVPHSLLSGSDYFNMLQAAECSSTDKHAAYYSAFSFKYASSEVSSASLSRS
jgi:SOS-response transcriptional repressor LexA